MSINAAPIISTTPLSYSNKPYQEPALHEIPDGTSETTE